MQQIRFGISHKPTADDRDEALLDTVAGMGHRALELGFTAGFPWKEPRMEKFGEMAAERGIRLSLHAPYFAVLTIDDEERSRQCVAALEHTMKLGDAGGARMVCAHLGARGEKTPEQLHAQVRNRLDGLAAKVSHRGIGLGLETSGTLDGFGTLGDVALLANDYRFVYPLVDWAHLHAVSSGGLVDKAAFEAVLRFLVDQVEAWKIEPVQAQFSDNVFGPRGEIRHTRYGEGTLRVSPLVEALIDSGIEMVLISESRDQESHRQIQTEVFETAASVEAGGIEHVGTVKVEPDAGKWRTSGWYRPLTLTNLDKPLFPDGTTKRDLSAYYQAVSEYLLPHLAGHPLTLVRHPDGIDGESFYEKRAPKHRPDWVRTAQVPSDSAGGEISFVVADSRATLMWLANLACIDLHPLHSREGSSDNPDYAIFDLDPAAGAQWSQVVTVALLVRQALDGLGMRSYPKLSGSKGIHIYLPLDSVHSHRRVRRFVEAIARLLAAADPDDITLEWEVAKREGKVLIDAGRNASGQNVASVYSVRPLAGAPVSMPITWEEVATRRNGDFTISNAVERIHARGDLFRPVLAGGQTLDAAELALGLTAVDPVV